ncbi:unnamed protein product [Protopolystoma xenopodis]|uniref:Uncharacterized protein n=1 Tax=Protopolystoma xenopodis TaxID=117903 RepID=A0A3S5BSI9_9PLAT|nr:unnamed protein product [Protopolystoma xenopodis]
MHDPFLHPCAGNVDQSAILLHSPPSLGLISLPLAMSLVQVFHSTPATPSVLLEALLPLPSVWVTNLRLKPLNDFHGQAFAAWTTSLVQQAYCQPTSSSLRRVYPVSIPKTKSVI